MNRFTVLVIAAAALPLIVTGVTREQGLSGRLAQLEEALERRSDGAPKSDVEALESRLASLSAGLAEDRTSDELREEILRLRAELELAQAAMSAQSVAITDLETLAVKARRIDAMEAGVEGKYDGIVRALDATTSLVHKTRDQLGKVESKLARDSQTQWRAMVGPTVQLSGETTVGSGVLLPSRPDATDPAKFQTLLLTSWHVVRDIRADARDADTPVPVILRDVNGGKRHFKAKLVDYDATLDSALLILSTTERISVGAHLPSRARLASSKVFDAIVAVGCPLGNDPIPTRGHLSDLHHQVDGERFLMISAPTYIGNSGGGLYSQSSHELLGIFSKIYTHGAVRPTVIPHMGLVTPLEAFYDWIDANDKARVIETADGAAIVLR